MSNQWQDPATLLRERGGGAPGVWKQGVVTGFTAGGGANVMVWGVPHTDVPCISPCGVGDNVWLVELGLGNRFVIGKTIAKSSENPRPVGGAGEPAFLNGWVNYGSNFAPVVFWKDPEGFVWITGMGTKVSGGGAIFNLPVGYRPPWDMDFSSISNGGRVECVVKSNGDVGDASLGSSWVTFNGIVFPTDISRFRWVGAPGEPALQNGWIFYGPPYQGLVDGTNRSVGFYLDANGFVHLTGLVKSGTMNTAIFSLPVGLRPPVLWMATTTTSGSTARIDIDPFTGAVTPVVGSNAYVGLDGIIFPTDMRDWHPLRPYRTGSGFWENYSDNEIWGLPGYFVDNYDIAHFSGLMAGGTTNADIGIPGPGLVTRSGLQEINRGMSNNSLSRIDTFKAGVPVAQAPHSSLWSSLHSVLFRVARPGG